MAATNFVSAGRYMDYTPVGAITAGDVVVVGELVGVATSDIAAGALGALAIEGIFDFPKAVTSGTAFTNGQLAYWDDTGDVATTTASTHEQIGYAVEAAADATTRVKIKLVQGARA